MANAASSTLVSYLRCVLAAWKDDPRPDADLLAGFADRGDEHAFTTLVGRHGLLVWGTCLRLLHDPHAAEDAFQATFLALAQKASRLRLVDNASLSGWLHRVARRKATDIWRDESRRREYEQQAHTPGPDAPEQAAEYAELCAVFDEELDRLPEKYRLPLLLCQVQARPYAEAARELGCSITTVYERLVRGQDLLRQRLTRRGLSLATGSVAVLLASGGVAGAVPATVSAATVAAAVSWARQGLSAWNQVAGITLAAKLWLGKLRFGVLALGAGLLLVAGAFAVFPRPVPPADTSTPPASVAQAISSDAHTDNPAAVNDEREDAAEMLLAGRTLDTTGRPLPHAHVAVYGRRPFRPGERNIRDNLLARTRADATGRFRLHLRRSSPAWSLRTRFVQLWAAAPGHAPATLVLPWRPDTSSLDVRLPRPDLIRGRLEGDDGQPAAGVRVVVYQIGSVRLEPIQGLADVAEQPALWPAPVTTAPDGSFTIGGLNLKQGVRLRVCDERYALRKAVLTPAQWSGRVGTLRLAPARLLTGRVQAADTGRPLAGARLSILAWDAAGQATGSPIDARADDAGSFHVRLLPGASYRVEAFAPDGTPYLAVHRLLRWPSSALRHELELSLPRGTLIRGTVTVSDKGEPVLGAHVQFRPEQGKATAVPAEILTGLNGLVASGADGVFRLVVPDVPGHLIVHEPSGDYVTEEVSLRRADGLPGRRLYANRVMPLEPSCGQAVREVDVVLRRGVSITGRVVGPDGAPVAEGAWLCRGRTCPQEPAEGQPQPFWDGRLTLRGCTPGRVYPVLFLDAKHRLGARADLRAEPDGKPAEVRLQPCGEAEVRFLDQRRRPVAGHQPFLYVMVPPDGVGDEGEEDLEERPAEMHELDELDLLHYRDGPRTDTDGRVLLPALIPGVRYRMNHYVDLDGGWREFEAAAGQTLSLPDVIIKRPR
jgi:RNA polymerase sigma factor (sigma-70 family)